MSNQSQWYIIQVQDGNCQIVALENNQTPDAKTSWGPFASQAEAIARRVGLIRAGKCQPQ